MHISTMLYILISFAIWAIPGCTVLYPLTLLWGCSICMQYACWGVISALRVYAIGGRRWFIPLVVMGLYLIPVATTIYMYSLTAKMQFPAPTGCVTYQRVSIVEQKMLIVASRAAIIAADLMVLVVTWRATYWTLRSAHMLGTQQSLMSLSLRDGTSYFGALLILGVINMVMYYTQITDGMSYIVEPLTTMLLSRLLLNLRRASFLQADAPSNPSQLLSLVFASHPEDGNVEPANGLTQSRGEAGEEVVMVELQHRDSGDEEARENAVDEFENSREDLGV
ncbi:hypothetical protein WOLCODRAFT_136408 [Wolfiporia cocos MD-104 SS10]|uniref:Uncharacterized protein n=1 Tax=Wolfiporia cocos (strain MD-104) TaxID=742152 RepID=A0A2H3J911_WOLCO|nr:hypothetical protein WOLCODRAFT_136408 [Wolfiporia cocos MD-104 SS10]